MIIGVNGYAGSGKDTVGIMIQYLLAKEGKPSIEEVCKNYSEHEWWLDESSEWEIRKFAGKLKDIASHLTGIDREEFENQDFKKTVLGPEWDYQIDKFNPVQKMTVRDLLQKLGTECMRNGLHTNTWVNALMADYTQDEDGRFPNWIVTDTRFENEAKAIKDKGGVIIRVNRPGVSPINTHPSEVGLDDWKFDYTIANISDLFDLKVSVENILKHLKLLKP